MPDLVFTAPTSRLRWLGSAVRLATLEPCTRAEGPWARVAFLLPSVPTVSFSHPTELGLCEAGGSAPGDPARKAFMRKELEGKQNTM